MENGIENSIRDTFCSFQYGGLDRLTAQKIGPTTVEGFAFDTTGNRTSKTAGTATIYSYPQKGSGHYPEWA